MERTLLFHYHSSFLYFFPSKLCGRLVLYKAQRYFITSTHLLQCLLNALVFSLQVQRILDSNPAWTQFATTDTVRGAEFEGCNIVKLVNND